MAWGQAAATWHGAGPCPAHAAVPAGLAQPSERCPSSVPERGACSRCGKCLPGGTGEQGTAMVSPRAWAVADGAGQRGRGGHPGQPCQGAALPSSALCSRPSRSWLTRGCFIAREPSGRGSLPGDGRGFLQRDFCARCFPSLLAQCLWAARASGAPSWSVGFKEALPVLVTLGGD